MASRFSISGNTLIEVLTSLALIGLVFSIAATLILGQIGTQSPIFKYQNEKLMQSFLAEGHPGPGTFEKNVRGRKLVKVVELHNPRSGLYFVEVRCFHGNRMLGKKMEWQFDNDKKPGDEK